MSFKRWITHPIARVITARAMRKAMDPVGTQRDVLRQLLRKGSHTAFGREHQLEQVSHHASLVQAVPLREYEGLRPYIDRIIAGERDVLWPGSPVYLSKTSGTTSGAKYIPITRDSLPHHIAGARRALLAYVAHSEDASFVDGKMIFLQGSPAMERKGAIPMGRLSGIVANHVPRYLLKNRLPSYAVNILADWEEKVDAIVRETLPADMRLISGIPAWVQMYFERLLAVSGKRTVKEVFPNFSLFVHGGVNYEPYRARMEMLIGGRVPSVEIFPASEGFVAYQDRNAGDGLLLVLDGGIYYEFIPQSGQGAGEKRLSIAEVELGMSYALVLHTNAGLWGYELGDTVRFVSLSPPRIVVTGRTKHFTSAFGEHVIVEEVEDALRKAMAAAGCHVVDFTVAPQLTPAEGLPHHEWSIEFGKPPQDMTTFTTALDQALQQRNPYYKDLITGGVLRPLVVRPLSPGSFNNWMRSRGMNDAQSKVPRLCNDRRYANELTRYA